MNFGQRTAFRRVERMCRCWKSSALGLIVLGVLPLIRFELRAQSVDGFDYPVGNTGYVTESDDGDGYYNAQDWTESHSTYYGHCGEDWNGENYDSTDYGDPVYAAADGWVTEAADFGGSWGLIITIEHTIDGAGHPDYDIVETQYAHLSAILVQVGDWVNRRDEIGAIGDANGYYSGAAHLHFEFRWDETMAANDGGYGCYDETSGTADPSDFIDDHRDWSVVGDWDYCSDSSPCDAGEGDCDSDSECRSGLTCVQDVGANYGWSSSVDVCEETSAPGDWDYCSSSAPCSEGYGDCDGDSQCMGGLVCVSNVGSNYGWDSGVDVCESALQPGDWNYCSSSNPCGEGLGDCDSDDECESGLTCVQNVGDQYGWSADVDVCEAGAQPGDWDYCSTGQPCEEGLGDCDSDDECQSGLVCVKDVGADYGWTSTVDVCESESTCHSGSPGGWDYCSSSCPCTSGFGDCDDDSECQNGLTCVSNVGASYGWDSNVDVCE